MIFSSWATHLISNTHTNKRNIKILSFNLFLILGITFPSGETQKRLLEEVYSEANVNPADVSYVEAHGTGTKAGDPQEVNTIAEVFCKERSTPLLIGSVKSNMGHAEPASGTGTR